MRLHLRTESATMTSTSLEAQFLSKLGINSKRIKVFCQKEAVLCFNNPEVNGTMYEVLTKQLGVDVFESYQMEEWNEGNWKSGNRIQTAKFKISSDKLTDGI